MIEEDPILLTPSDKIEPTSIFRWKVHVNFPSRAESVLSPNSVNFYTNGSLLNGQAGALVYSESQDIGALGALTTVFQSKVFAIFACSKTAKMF
jgi:hypothetical protein